MTRILTAMLLAVALVAAACGGGDDDAEPEGADGTADAGADGVDGDVAAGDDDGSTQGQGAGDGASGGAVDGAVIIVSGLGSYGVSADATEGTPIEFADMDGVSVGTEPVTDGEGAYVLTFRTLEGQSFAAEAFVGRVDLATGETSTVARIGVDRESDDAEELTEYGPMVAIDGEVWVYSQVFGESTGELLRLSPDSPDGPVASVTLSRPQALHTDGEMIYVWTESGLTVIDPATGSTSVLVPTGVVIAEAAPDVDLGSLVISRSGAAPAAEDLDFVARSLAVDGGSINGTTLGDGVFWVSIDGVLSTSAGDTVLAEALVGFDVTDGTVTAVIPTIGDGDYFFEENSVDVGDSEIAAFDGAVWIVDRQDNGALLRVDPASGEVAVTYEPCAPPLECEDASFILTDPDALWLDVTRYEVTGEGSRSGEIWVERIDTGTGAVAASASVQSLIF
ncbi:MAG: hypothetical protein RIE08_14385 [Acidimicrobiales bacterium]